MIRAAVVLALLSCVAAQEPAPLFSIREDAGTLLVSANRAAVQCDEALEALGRALDWPVRYPASSVRERLSDAIVDLSFTDRTPRVVAGLIAAAGGADLVVLERGAGPTARPELVVVDPPDAATEAGRERLRGWALGWYRACLAERQKAGKDEDDDSLHLRIRMAELLRIAGARADAAALLEQVFEIAPDREFIPQVLLRLAQCWFELGPDTWLEAERRARDLTRLHPSRPEAAAGTVLLGRILLAQGRAAECAAMMEQSFLRLADAPEIVDVFLLLGVARYRLGDPAAVAKALATLEGGHDAAHLDGEQRAEWSFLTGYAALERGMSRRAVRAFEQWFALTGPDDPSRGAAFVMLGRGYLDEGRYLQARAAAVAARAMGARLDRRAARQAAELYASTSLALGDEDRALQELESEVRRDPDADGELTLFLARTFLERTRFTRCVDLLTGLVDRRDDVGDRARLLRVEAAFAQARETGSFESFVASAPAAAGAIVDPDRQRRAADLVGRAFEAVGDLERAADAYRGVMR